MTTHSAHRSVALASVLFVLAAAIPRAQMAGAPTDGFKLEPGMTASAVPAPLREIGFDQHLDDRIPLDAPFKDEDGRDVTVGTYFGPRPVVLALVYYSCPMLCTQVLSGLTSALGVLSLEPGKDFDVVAISFDPRETPADAAAKKAATLDRGSHKTAAVGWHFLTGPPASIDRVTRAAGFRYVWDEPTRQFAHPTGVIVMTPDGRFARYLFGVEYGPRDLRLALVEASSGKIGSVVDTLLLYCYHYDPTSGRYGLVVMRTLRAAGAATVLALVSFIVVMARRDRGRSQRTGA